MNTTAITSAVKKAGLTLSKHSPTILAVLGGTTSIAALIEAVRVTPNAMKDLEEMKPETNLDKIKVAGKHYIPAAIMELFALGCIFSSHKITLGRAAVISTLYSTSEEKLKEYQAKVIEKIGPKKEEQIRDELAISREAKALNGVSPLIASPVEGMYQTYDSWTGQHFWATSSILDKAENRICEQLRGDWYVSLNEFYEALKDCGAVGVRGGDVGGEVGWDADHPIKIDYTYEKRPDGSPYIVMTYDVSPKFRFDML